MHYRGVETDLASIGTSAKKVHGPSAAQHPHGRFPGFRNAHGFDSHIHASPTGDRKSTRLNSSHVSISYAVFCLKKKKKKQPPQNHNTPRISQKKQPTTTLCPRPPELTHLAKIVQCSQGITRLLPPTTRSVTC